MADLLSWKLEWFAGPLQPEIASLLWSALWGFAHLVLIGQLARSARGWRWTAGPRDEAVPPLAGVAGRLERAFRNYLETYPFFVALIVAALVSGRTNDLTAWGSFTYVWGRIIYVPLYATGLPLIRSLAWNIAALGLLAVFAGIIRG